MCLDIESLVDGDYFSCDGLWEYCVGKGFGMFWLVFVVEY